MALFISAIFFSPLSCLRRARHRELHGHGVILIVVFRSVFYYTGIFDRTDIDFNHISGRNLDLGVGDVWTISPTLIADFRVSDMRFHWDVQATGEGMPYSQFGLGYL